MTIVIKLFQTLMLPLIKQTIIRNVIKILSSQTVIFVKKIIDYYTESNKNKYHQSCFINNVLEKCSICIKPLNGEYLLDFFWK